MKSALPSAVRLALLTVAAIVWWGAGSAAAQEISSTLRGTVKDAAGGVIQGVQVELARVGGGKTVTRITDPNGDFEISGVAAGPYQVTVATGGFQKEVRTVTLGASPLELQIILQPEAVRESLTVTERPGYEVAASSGGTRTLTPLRDIPQAIQVVNRELMMAQGATSMQDALRNVAGVSVHLGEGRRDQVYIRGFSALRDSYVDGVRDDATYYRDLSNFESVEVIKGPASVLYGRGSSGGIVNRTTKKPDPERPLAEVGVMVGSYGMKRTTADLGLPLFGGELAFRMNGAYEDSGSHRHYFSLNRYNVTPALMWRPTDRTQALFQFEHLADDRLPDRGIPSVNGRPADVPIGLYYGHPEDDFLNNHVTAQAATLDHQFSSTWSIRNVLRHTKYRTAYSNTYATGIRQSAAGLLATRGQYNSNGYQENYFNQTETVKSGYLLGMNHTVLVGIEVGAQDLRTDRFTGSVDPVFLLNPQRLAPRYALVPGTSNLFEGDITGIYVQDQIRVTQRWKALVGARWDRYRQQVHDFTAARANFGRTDRAVSPRAGIVFQPTSITSLYASYSKSFQPSGEGLSLAANNKDLKPETAQNYEVGAKNDLLNGRLTASVALFRLDRNNLRTIDPVDPTRLILVGQQRTDGLEISLSGSLARNWSLQGGWALLDSKILKSNDLSSGVPIQGKRSGHIPRNNVTFWSTYAFDNGFGFGGGLTHNSDRFTSNDNLVLLPAYTRADMTVFYRKRKYDLILNVRNLFDTHYYETAHGNFAIYPGAPVNGLLSMRYRW